MSPPPVRVVPEILWEDLLATLPWEVSLVEGEGGSEILATRLAASDCPVIIDVRIPSAPSPHGSLVQTHRGLTMVLNRWRKQGKGRGYR